MVQNTRPLPSLNVHWILFCPVMTHALQHLQTRVDMESNISMITPPPPQRERERQREMNTKTHHHTNRKFCNEQKTKQEKRVTLNWLTFKQENITCVVFFQILLWPWKWTKVTKTSLDRQRLLSYAVLRSDKATEKRTLRFIVKEKEQSSSSFTYNITVKIIPTYFTITQCLNSSRITIYQEN